MENFTALPSANLSACERCVAADVFTFCSVPHFFVSVLVNVRAMVLIVSSSVFQTDKMDVFGFYLVVMELVYVVLLPVGLMLGIAVDVNVGLRFLGLLTVTFIGRILFQSCVCVECYVAVVRPLLYRRLRPLRYRLLFSAGVLLLSCLVGGILMLFCNTSETWQGISFSVVTAVLSVNTFCCLRVLRALRRPSPGEQSGQGANRVKRRAFNVVLLFQATTMLSSLPLIVLSFISEQIELQTFCVAQGLASFVSVWLGLSFPLLYLSRAGKIPALRWPVCG